MIRLLGHYLGVIRHKGLVARYLLGLAVRLAWRALVHDLSKLAPIEARGFARAGLKGHVYGSAGYRAARLALGPALDHHYRANRHHPEHFQAGLAGMDLVDLAEMLCDWRAAVRLNPRGSLERSFQVGRTRFGLGEELEAVLRNTVEVEGRRTGITAPAGGRMRG